MRELLNNWELLGGVVFIIMGTVLLIKCLIDRKISVRIPGEIVDFVYSQEGVYFPMISFTYEGEELCMKCGNGDKKKKAQVGDSVIVLYNPRNHKYVNVAGNYTDIITCIMVILLGILFVYSELR